MLNIKDNLHKSIKECEDGAENEMTYLEFIIYGYACLNTPLTENQIYHIAFEANNEELNDILEDLDYLCDK